MENKTGVRALKRLFRLKSDEAESVQTGRTAAVNQSELSETDEPDIMYLEETPVINAQKKFKEVKQQTVENEQKGRNNKNCTMLRKMLNKLEETAQVSDSELNHIRRQRRRKKRLAAYFVTSLVLVAAMLVFVLPEGGNAATEKIVEKTVVLNNNPRVEQINIDESLLNVEEDTAQVPDAPNVTSMLFDNTSNADAAAKIMDSAEATPEPTPEPTSETESITTPVAVDEFVSFFVDESGGYYDEAGYSKNSYEYTEDDIYMLAQIITSEAGGEPFEGMVAVGNVVMNRVLNTDEFGSAIARVVKKSGQFAYSSRKKPSLAAMQAAEAVLEDEYWVLPQNVYFFKSHSIDGKDWGRNEYYTTIQGHCFYLYAYSGRYNGEGIPPKLYERTYEYAQYGCTPSERVLRIQQMLNAIGFHVNESSYFDESTRDALTLFQQTNGLNADGIAAPDTIAALIRAYGFENYLNTYVYEDAA